MAICSQECILTRRIHQHLYGHPAAGRNWEKERNKEIMEMFNKDGWTWMLVWTDDCDLVGEDEEHHDSICRSNGRGI